MTSDSRKIIVDMLVASSKTDKDVETIGDLFAEGIIDSVSILGLLLEIESSFAIAIGEDELSADNFKSVDALVRLVEAHRAA